MFLRISAVALAVAFASGAMAQVAPSRPAAADPANKPLPVPASTVQANPAAAPMHPASDAGATERGLAPVRPGNPGVTNRVQDANVHGVDTQGHTLDPHGRPVGQTPAVPVAAGTVR
ncbi:hypothetical protein SAMN02800694_3351 [Luteibacter sp. UNCMF331Sha3.1]|uniref:hypothetical protein n=1 Tax=Luteibacter sp. UNCMF331Sha3.1 TaxID=1502760 RepID=UPI0008ADDCAC|nr:hypothetical protein [Luteibacter sp. UNCMF331Sha3.1]SEN37580.1 hypothetical protein SAMN02800694_3351 [Luteibacter sp. UNCMF331Sha3.1]